MEQVKTIMQANDNNDTFFFRGQETEFWRIEPSIFRDDFISIEHTLMQEPLLKVPNDFSEADDVFDILTKYQHYGMCTRLLDLTTNPLVALYFACKKHGEVEYQGESKEPYGVVYYNRSYPVFSNDINVKIITALTKIDLSKENTFEYILEKLYEQRVIERDRIDRWCSKDRYLEFIDILQNNYIVLPTYSNDRLLRQNGMFLLAGCFSVEDADDPKNCVVSKDTGDLRTEFEQTTFYVDGEDKEAILQELDVYNINEATLFPELEHQLNYIKNKNKSTTRITSYYTKFMSQEREQRNVIEIEMTGDMEDELKAAFEEQLQNIIEEQALRIRIWNGIEQYIKTVDWYRRDNILSKMRMKLTEIFMESGRERNEAKRTAGQIVELSIQMINQVMKKE